MSDYTYTTAEERYKKYIESLQSRGENVTTRTKAFFKDLFLIKERRENKGIEPPADVIMGRRMNDSLHRIEQHLEKIEAETEDIHQSVGSFWSGIGQALAERKARKEAHKK